MGHVNDLARRARELGFPILTAHGFESTLWIMAEGMRLEMEAALASDVVLVDRPVLDALGYLRAALEVTRRTIPDQRMEELNAIVRSHSSYYDFTVVTVLDEHVPLGPDRDPDTAFRVAAARQVTEIVDAYVPGARRLALGGSAELLADATEFVLARRR